MYENDERVVMTLDAGGTNFVFSAMRACREIVTPVRLDAVTDDAGKCLETLVKGFKEIESKLDCKPVAISFAFPGPADYANGIIGDLPNFPCFRGGVAMGPFLAETFGIPVFINNDGNLFAYGEALVGALPRINAALEAAGSSKRYKNLLGITIGTGFGGGVVLDGTLLTGDNGCGGDVWLMRNRLYPDMIAEDGVSKRAVTRVYHENAPEDKRDVNPTEIFQIAEGTMEGNPEAAKKSFTEMGITAAEAVAHALDIVDGLVVIGGGISHSHKYIIPPMVEALNSDIHTMAGAAFPCLQMTAYDLTTDEGMKDFAADGSVLVDVPGFDKKVRYCSDRKVGVTVTTIGTSEAVALGAYTYALSQIDKA